MPKDLLIVESPAKAKTISKYLGPDYQVVASIGHIKDLPKSKLGVDIEHDFAPEYVPSEGKLKVISDLKKAAKGKETIFLGPDPDREGEAIAWHIASELKSKDRVFKRVLFHELTPQAIKAALADPVEISAARFESQQTRRILDRLVGYLISPVLWDKLKIGLSAGRVQSVALRLVVERERLINAFTPEEYWSVTALFEETDPHFSAALILRLGEKIALGDEDAALAVVSAVTGADFKVESVASKDRQRRPFPPFTTSTLQQAAYKRLGLAPSRTMRLAQHLYEGVELPDGAVGLITYMRTDSVRVSDQAAGEARAHAAEAHGESFIPPKPIFYKNKKGAQDAHEAVRPTSVNRTPDKLKSVLDKEHWQLYDLIWRRFVASQMSPAIVKQTTADLSAGDYTFRATGSVITFKGFLAVYDPGSEEGIEVLPPLEVGQKLKAQSITPKQHFTQPPPRFNEGTLVKELEDKGIGRPSTYASIISVLRDKEYVSGLKGQLRPTELGLTVSDLLVENFPDIMDVDFTAGLEENLDQIEEGEAEHLAILRKLYTPLRESIEEAKKSMRNVKKDGIPVSVPCPKCGRDDKMAIRYGRNGFYMACGACDYTTDFTRDDKGLPVPTPPPTLEAEVLCDKCGLPMVPKRSRYGLFLACSGYPDCKNSKSLKTNGDGLHAVDDEKAPPLPEGFDPVCPKCGAAMTVKKARKGNWFIACTGYPDCKNAAAMPTGLKCPRPGCGGDIVEKTSMRGAFLGCSNYPECNVILGGTPVLKACPDCGHPYMVESTRRGTAGQIYCPNPDCPAHPAELKAAAAARAKKPKGSARAKTGAAKASASKAGAAKTRAAKTGAAKTGAAKTGASKARAAKTGAAKTGASKTGAPRGSSEASGPALSAAVKRRTPEKVLKP